MHSLDSLFFSFFLKICIPMFNEVLLSELWIIGVYELLY